MNRRSFLKSLYVAIIAGPVVVLTTKPKPKLNMRFKSPVPRMFHYKGVPIYFEENLPC